MIHGHTSIWIILSQRLPSEHFLDYLSSLYAITLTTKAKEKATATIYTEKLETLREVLSTVSAKVIMYKEYKFN